MAKAVDSGRGHGGVDHWIHSPAVGPGAVFAQPNPRSLGPWQAPNLLCGGESFRPGCSGQGWRLRRSVQPWLSCAWIQTLRR